ncbi:MAG: response regulator [Proteobacteria bacterium]|nr:response regulator [Pseudomonadota bacterium]
MLESFSLDRYYSEKLFQIFGTLPLIGKVIKQNQMGLKQLFGFCRLFKYLPREEIIASGRYNSWIFFVLNGECLVVDDEDRNVTVETIESGQMFGELDVVMDATGQKTVLADPASQEVILLGFDSSVFMAQSNVRLVDDATRIGCYQSLFSSLRARHKLLVNILREQTKREDLKDYEPFAFEGNSDSKLQLMFFDIETKKQAMELIGLHSQVFELARNRKPGSVELKTYLTDEQFDRQKAFAFAQELPFQVKSTKIEMPSEANKSMQTEPERSKDKSVYQIQELSFLVVDDDDHHRESAVTILKDLGAGQIHIEKNGRAAWDFVCAHPNEIDIVLCDWIMPEMTGLDFYHKIQESGDHLGGVVFIMLTSIESKTSVLEAVENGVHGYVIKPVNQKHILKQIQQALKHVRGAILKT